MKRSSKVANLKRTNQQEPKHSVKKDGKSILRHWAVPALCLLLSAGGAWAVFEFVVWNRLPAELVGKWVVEGGAQDGATFDFSRSGNLEAHLNNKGMEELN
jgi:hypothetical protein